MATNQPYDKLEGDFREDDPLDDTSNPPPKPRFLTTSNKKPWVITGLTIVALAVAVLLALGAVHQSSSHSAPSNTTTPTIDNTTDTSLDTKPDSTNPHDLGDVILDCGNNYTVARQKNCIYDVMMQLWIPAPCYDGTLSERFLADGNWTWWADSGATTIISDERIKLGEHEVTYVSADYHATHCMYAWELLVRSLRTQKPIIEPLISYDHAVHCRHKALKAHDSHGAIAPTRYTQCAMYETWVKHLPENRFSSEDK